MNNRDIVTSSFLNFQKDDFHFPSVGFIRKGFLCMLLFWGRNKNRLDYFAVISLNIEMCPGDPKILVITSASVKATS